MLNMAAKELQYTLSLLTYIRRIKVKKQRKVVIVLLNYDRYDAALERKTKISEIIRSLDLPNNPLDDITDQVVITCLIYPPCFENHFVKCSQQYRFSITFKGYFKMTIDAMGK